MSADDTILLFRIKPLDLNQNLEEASTGVRLAIDQFSRLGFAVILSKTCLMLFKPVQRGIEVGPMTICGSKIPLSSSAVCLGVTLNAGFKWDDHLDTLSGKCYAVIASLRRLRQCRAPRSVLLMSYRSLFEPILSYCVLVWGGGNRETTRRARICRMMPSEQSQADGDEILLRTSSPRSTS